MKSTRLISVVVPMHNEEANVRPLLAELHGVMKTLNARFEIIVVDDGSRDGTFAALESLCEKYPELQALRLRVKSGQSTALQAGFDAASGDYIATIDGDLQNDPHDFPAMIAQLEQGCDFVSGWREKRQDRFFSRRMPSLLANALIRRVTRTSFRDLGCSTKVFRREVIQELRLYGEMHRMLGVLVERMGFKTAQVPVNHRSRGAGKSKYGLKRTYKVLLDIMLVNFLRGYRSNPLHFFGGLGMLCFGLSFVFTLGAGVEKLWLDTSVHRNPLFSIGMVMAVAGIQLSLMGFLAELMVRNYFESTHQRSYSIQKTVGRKPAKARLKRVA